MKTHNYLLVVALIFLVACQQTETKLGLQVTNAVELQSAIAKAKPGSTITMKNGIWNDLQIKFYGEGTESQPITLKAETAGEVYLQGNSNLRLGGEHLVVDGLYFTNGATPSRSVIQFYLNKDTVVNHSQVTNCVIKDYNQSQKNKQDLWVLLKGRHNQLDHCYLAGKSNRGPTVRVDLAGNESIKNYHKIHHNHFGPRPPKGGPSAETIQIGNSSTSMAPSHTIVAQNLFDRCNGEVEVISSKTNFNEFRNNVFYKSEGSLVTRHGNYCLVDGNYFIGDESPYVGGVRLIGSGHRVTNNYFYNLRGKIFRAPVAVMNGIRKSAINRYIQVTDVVVAYNTWIDCDSTWQFGVGSNVDQKDVLPASEIRSETPIRTTVANNVIYNSEGNQEPIVRHDSIAGITFKSNVIDNKGVSFKGVEGLEEHTFSLTELSPDLYVPASKFTNVDIYNGFEFDQIKKDLFGNSREKSNVIGATNGTTASKLDFMDFSHYGPAWFDAAPSAADSQTHSASTTSEIVEAISNANEGDIILLTSGRYELSAPLKINKSISILSADTSKMASLVYSGKRATPVFEMYPKGQLMLKSIKLQGSGNNYCFASLKENMSSLYNLNILNCEVSNFEYVLKAYKYSFAEHLSFESTIIKDCKNGIELSSEDDNKGEYNAENLSIINCEFESINKNVIDYYRGGYDESTVGGNLIIQGSSFSKCGGGEKDGVLIKTHGIINVDLTRNTFTDNSVTLVARLWGAKNNSASNNTFKNSGRIVTEENLVQKLLY